MKCNVEREQSIQEREPIESRIANYLRILKQSSTSCRDHYERSCHWQLEIAYGPRLQRELAYMLPSVQLNWTGGATRMPICLHVFA